MFLLHHVRTLVQKAIVIYAYTYPTIMYIVWLLIFVCYNYYILTFVDFAVHRKPLKLCSFQILNTNCIDKAKYWSKLNERKFL